MFKILNCMFCVFYTQSKIKKQTYKPTSILWFKLSDLNSNQTVMHSHVLWSNEISSKQRSHVGTAERWKEGLTSVVQKIVSSCGLRVGNLVFSQNFCPPSFLLVGSWILYLAYLLQVADTKLIIFLRKGPCALLKL